MELSLSDGSMLLLAPGGGGAVGDTWEACLAHLYPVSPRLSPSLPVSPRLSRHVGSEPPPGRHALTHASRELSMPRTAL